METLAFMELPSKDDLSIALQESVKDGEGYFLGLMGNERKWVEAVVGPSMLWVKVVEPVRPGEFAVIVLPDSMYGLLEGLLALDEPDEPSGDSPVMFVGDILRSLGFEWS